MLVSFIEIINNLIHPKLVGAPKSHHTHEWLEEAVHHMSLVEEKWIIDELLESPMKIIIQL